MKQKIDRELLIKYLEGRLPENDEKELIEWLAADRANREQFDLLQKIWRVSDISLPEPDMEKAWLNIRNRIAAAGQAGSRNNRFVTNKISFFRNRVHFRLALAVAFTFLIISGIYLITQLSQPVSMKQIRVNHKQQITQLLPDGTRLILDAGTVLQYPEQFSKNERVVWLDGEAYFDVVSDSSRPFIIHTNEAKIQVLGTKFNIRSWLDENKVTVAVVTGIVSVKANENRSSENRVTLYNYQFSILQGKKPPTPPRSWDGRTYISWMQHEMYFQDEPLRAVLDQLQRWYDLKFELPDEQTAAIRMTIFIDNRPLDDLLNLIEEITGLSYRKDAATIKFLREN